jgi:hypothetical protein
MFAMTFFSFCQPGRRTGPEFWRKNTKALLLQPYERQEQKGSVELRFLRACSRPPGGRKKAQKTPLARRVFSLLKSVLRFEGNLAIFFDLYLTDI